MTFGVSLRGTGEGRFEVWNESKQVGEIPVTASGDWAEHTARLDLTGVHPLYLVYRGGGFAELLDIFFQS